MRWNTTLQYQTKVSHIDPLDVEDLGQTSTVNGDYNHAVEQLYKLWNFDFAEIPTRLIQFTQVIVGFFIVLFIFINFAGHVLVLLGLVHHVLGYLFFGVCF